MTIKELEERTGMTRANIRFYESEGLIAPKRLDNGYRDYSEEDAETLEKIRLLRELHLDIDTIRLVQKGELTLEQALFNLLTRLEGDKAAIDRAVEVCRQLEKSRVEYGALDPKPWLKQLEPPRRPELEPPDREEAPQAEEPVDYACCHPWRRWLARALDGTIYSLVIDAVLLLGFRWNYHNAGNFAAWFEGLLVVGLALLCEPFWLHFWGWTPGKWICGLKLRNYQGDQLTLREGFHRVGSLFVSGYGCTIPLVNLYCYCKFWKRYKREEDSPWDIYDGNVYTYEKRKWSWLMYIGVTAACIGLTGVIMLQAYLPPNRGDLTAAEFCENYNFYLDYLNTGYTADLYRLDEGENWVSTYASGSGTTLVYEWKTWQGRWTRTVTFAVDDGSVTGVILREELEDGQALYISQAPVQIAALALAGARREFNCFNYDWKGWVELWNDKWDDFELDYRGLHISQTVECSGYEGIGQIRSAIEGQEQSYSRTVTISLNG